MKMLPVITLNSGGVFNYLDPDNSDYTIEDIAHGLSNTCRFSGQCSSFYSVAQHSVSASKIVLPKYAMHALLHDASEAFMCDLPSPLKQLLPEYKNIEAAVQLSIIQRFVSRCDHTLIKKADLIMLATERRDLLAYPQAIEWGTIKNIGTLDTIQNPLNPPEAKELFLKRYYELQELNND